MRARMWVGILFAAAALASTAQAQTPTGSVRVSVRAIGTEKGIEGAKIILAPTAECTECLTERLLDLPSNQHFDAFTVTGGPTTFIAFTDADGKAVLKGVKPGRYTVSAQHPEFVGGPVKGAGGFGGTVQVTSVSERITVDPARLSPEANFFLTPAASISGRVRNSDGSPAANFSVVLGNIKIDAGHRVFVATTGVRADAAGEYLLTWVTPAEYVVRVAHVLPASAAALPVYFPGDADLEKATLIVVESGKTLVGIDITLP